jgi:hypothetical protein
MTDNDKRRSKVAEEEWVRAIAKRTGIEVLQIVDMGRYHHHGLL